MRLVNWIIQAAENINYYQLFILVFVYSAFVAASVQIVILPKILPQWHAGHGLLTSSHDSITFHYVATELSENITQQGWKAWLLRPEGHSPAGIAAAIYAVTTPEPWTLIPFNALLHASSALILSIILTLITRRKWMATLSAMLFVVLPSAMQWYTQIHKDGITILGTYLVLFGWLHIYSSYNRNRRFFLLQGSLAIIAGSFLAWVARNDYLLLIFGASAFCFCLMVFRVLIGYLKGRRKIKYFDIARATVATILLFLIFQAHQNPSISGTQYEIALPSDPPPNSSVTSNQEHQINDIDSPNMSKSVLSAIEVLASLRRGYTSSSALGNSSIDTDVQFNSISDIVGYVPRATQIAFLSPFPNMWFGEGSTIPTTYFRYLVGGEMLIVYFCLIGLIFAAILWGNRGPLLISAIFSYWMMLPLALVVANVGTLHRLRYGSLMFFVSIGFAGLLSKFLNTPLNQSSEIINR